MNNNNYRITIKELILNIMYFETKNYLGIEILEEYFCYIFDNLAKNGLLKKYKIYIPSSRQDKIRSLYYLGGVFYFDEYAEIIYLNKNKDINMLIKENPIDEYIEYLIKNYNIENKKEIEKELTEKISKSTNDLLIDLKKLSILNYESTIEIEENIIKQINLNNKKLILKK